MPESARMTPSIADAERLGAATFGSHIAATSAMERVMERVLGLAAQFFLAITHKS
jgi:hypothetical protein